MPQSHECFACRRVSLLLDDKDTSKCPSCGSANGHVISSGRVREGKEAGAYFDIDLKTGGRAKPKKRR